MTRYARHLPHWRKPGATYFVTFRLADSLPKEKLHELDLLRSEWLTVGKVADTATRFGEVRHHSLRLELDSLSKEVVRRVERWLDQGLGECWLKRYDVAKIAPEAMLHFDQQEYELGCFVIMPKHVHAIFRPFCRDDDALSKVLHSRKLWMASRINKAVGRTGKLWQDESFDRIIRDEEHLYRCIQYIGRNPRRAGLELNECSRWIQPSWHKLGWHFE